MLSPQSCSPSSASIHCSLTLTCLLPALKLLPKRKRAPRARHFPHSCVSGSEHPANRYLDTSEVSSVTSVAGSVPLLSSPDIEGTKITKIIFIILINEHYLMTSLNLCPALHYLYTPPLSCTGINTSGILHSKITDTPRSPCFCSCTPPLCDNSLSDLQCRQNRVGKSETHLAFSAFMARTLLSNSTLASSSSARSNTFVLFTATVTAIPS